MTPAHVIAIGRVVGTHALRGELRVLLFNPESSLLAPGITIALRRDGTSCPHRIASVRRHKQGVLLCLEGCASIDGAAALVGAEVCVDASTLPPAGPGEVYHYELVGMHVVTLAGEQVGIVAEVLHTPAHDVCVVRDGAREQLIPLVADVVKTVDRAGRRLVIEPIAGLLEP